MHQHFHLKFLQFFMNNSWKRKCDKIKIILFDVSSCFTKIFLFLRFYGTCKNTPTLLPKIVLKVQTHTWWYFAKRQFFTSMKRLKSLKKWFLPYGKNHFRVKMYPISQQLTKIFLIESHQENKQVKQKWDTKIQKQ